MESGVPEKGLIMKIGEICNRNVVNAGRDTGIREAAELMRYHHVGDLLLTEERGGARHPVGIVTDRDLVVEVLAKGVAPDTLTIGDLVTGELVTMAETATVFEAIQLMRSKAVRRLPVVDRVGALVGIVSLDDLLDFLAEELATLARVFARQEAREARTRP